MPHEAQKGTTYCQNILKQNKGNHKTQKNLRETSRQLFGSDFGKFKKKTGYHKLHFYVDFHLEDERVKL